MPKCGTTQITSAAEHLSVSVQIRPPVLDVVSSFLDWTTVMQLWPAYHRIVYHGSSQS